jgi:methionyl-tRNA formyltransferase
LRIAFFGLPLAALLLLADGHSIAVAVLTGRDVPGRRRLTRRLGGEHVHVRGELSDGELVTRMRENGTDLLVSWFFTAKLPFSVVRAARLGGIGVHPSLLPRHRGPDPYFAAIDQGDRVTGVTVHRIEEEYDTGAILASQTVAVADDWNAWQLARRLDRPSLALLRETVARLRAGEKIPEREQDETQASLAPLPSAADCALSWSWSTQRILRRIRALAPAPGAFTEIGGHLVTVLAARLAPDAPRALVAGEAAVVDGAAVVCAADGAIELVHGEIDGQPVDGPTLASIVARSRDLI